MAGHVLSLEEAEHLDEADEVCPPHPLLNPQHKVFEPYIRARLRTAAHLCEVVVPNPSQGTYLDNVVRQVFFFITLRPRVE